MRDCLDLCERIIEAIESIPEDMLIHRLDTITVTAEAHCDVWPSKLVAFLFHINVGVSFYLKQFTRNIA